MESNWKELEYKKVHIILRNDFEYNGFIDKVDDAGNGLVFIFLTDKFGAKKIFSTGEVKFIEVKA